MTKGTSDKPEIDNKQAVGALLSPEERSVCEQVAAGEAPWSQRAHALLALDESATQAEAGARAGLSRGQLQYWLDRFRQDGLSIFPEAVLAETPPEPAPTSPQEPAEGTGRPKGKKKAKTKGKGKSKKKKGKKSKSAKKARKVKADKKPGKKSKKKMKRKE